MAAQSYPDEPSKGEAHKQDVAYIKDSITALKTIDLGGNPNATCCHVCPVFADASDDDEFKNDYRTAFYFFPYIYTVTMELEKYDEDTDTWNSAVDLVDDTYGTYLGDNPAADNQILVAYKLDFRIILIDALAEDLGAGCYRVKFNYDGGQFKYSPTYTLLPYNNELAEKTTRFTYMLDSIIGSEEQQSRRNFKGLEFTDQIRVCDSEFGFPSAEFTTEEVRLESGREDTYSKSFRKRYSWKTGGVTIEVFRFLLHTVFMADEIIIDDYNPDNPSGGHAQIYVEIDKNVDPVYVSEGALVKMDIEFKDAFNNNRKLYG